MATKMNVFIDGLGKSLSFEIDTKWTPEQLVKELNDQVMYPKHKQRLDHNMFWYTVNGKYINSIEQFSTKDIATDSSIRLHLRQNSKAYPLIIM